MIYQNPLSTIYSDVSRPIIGEGGGSKEDFRGFVPVS